jgi:hypothetical protein
LGRSQQKNGGEPKQTEMPAEGHLLILASRLGAKRPSCNCLSDMIIRHDQGIVW